MAQHTLFDFYLCVGPAVSGDFSGDVAAIRGYFFAIYQFLLYAATNYFKESLLEKPLSFHLRTLALLNLE